jgi:hypothetical protein
VADEPRRQGAGGGPEAAEQASRLHRQAHGVIAGDADLQALPLAPEPTRPGAPPNERPRAASPSAPVPQPSRIQARPAPVDDTVPVPMMDEEMMSRDGTPPPLPPSPASAAAEVWLEDAVTRPSALSDLAARLAGSLSSSSKVVVTAEIDPIEALREAHQQAARASLKLLLLSTATAFASGLALGAALFRGCG